ncbi:Mur ligase family protein, partial [Bacillus sp. B-TM1]
LLQSKQSVIHKYNWNPFWRSTVKDIIGSILSSTYRVHKTKGNFNSQIGLPLTILEMERNTEFLILEMGMSEKGQIRNLSRIAQPDVAVITMIGQSHLETLGSRKEIAKAKFEIVDGLHDGGLFNHCNHRYIWLCDS